MTAQMRDVAHVQAELAPLPALRLIVLARLACEDGATRSELGRDLAGYVQGERPRDLVDAELAALIRTALATENRSRFRASELGLSVLAGEFDLKSVSGAWSDLRDARIVAKALGLQCETATRIKGLARPDRLRAEVLAAAFGLKLRGAMSPTRLRSELAMIALERAFGQRIKGAVSARTGFNAKTARLLAGQLLVKPRDVGTDARLIGLLASEAVGSTKLDLDALRQGIIRRFVAGVPIGVPDGRLDGEPGTSPLAGRAAQAGRRRALPASFPLPASPTGPAPAGGGPVAAEAAGQRHPAASRPGLEGFAAAVQAVACEHAEGWPGSRKALISLVWQSISARHPQWGLSLIEFKAMLAEAHRTGHLALATADLRDKSKLKQLQDSVIAYKNTVWHLIRVVD